MSDEGIKHLQLAPPQGKSTARNKAKRISRAKAQMKVLQLAAAGLTNEEIAEHMKENNAPAFKSVYTVRKFLADTLKAWSERNSEYLAEYREMKLFELDQLRRAVWKDALMGDTDAVREARATIKLQLEMSGAAAPQIHEHRHTIGMDLEEQEIKAMEQAWVDADATELPELPMPEVEVVE